MVNFILIIKIFIFCLLGIILKVNENTMMSRERGLQTKRKASYLSTFSGTFFLLWNKGPHIFSLSCAPHHVVMALLSKLVSLPSEIH